MRRRFIERYAPEPEQLPLAVCPDGEVLRNPTENELARCIGMLGREPDGRGLRRRHRRRGPAGLAAAVYAASEGLSVLVLDARAFGGQAGASARIENYFGFPTGISGQALTGRAYHAGAEVRRADADPGGGAAPRLRAAARRADARSSSATAARCAAARS